MAKKTREVNYGNPVVASLPRKSPHPYSSIATSPNRRHAAVAGKDTLTILSVGPQGLSLVKSFRISQHFQQTTLESQQQSQQVSGTRTSSSSNTYGDIRETFGFHKPQQAPNMTTSEATVNCTHVAWSLPQGSDTYDSFQDNEIHIPTTSISSTSFQKSSRDTHNNNHDTLIAVAGSNGMVVIWNVDKSIFNQNMTSSQNPIPEAVLAQHTRAVNRVAFHPTGKRPEWLLTASQDSTVKLWERRTNRDGVAASSGKDATATPGIRSWFGMHSSFLHQSTNVTDRSVSWHCKFTFQPHSEVVRDIVWSPFDDNVFALVTGSGYLIVYNVAAPARPWVKVAAHSGEATTLDWHPTRKYIIATGGGSQSQRVKIWDLEKSMDLSKKDSKNIVRNAGSARSEISHTSSHASVESSDDTIVRSGTATPKANTLHDGAELGNMIASATRSLSSSTHSLNSSRTTKFTQATTRHVLSISASVTRLKWRPPSTIRSDGYGDEGEYVIPDRHDAMLAVSTAPIKGAHAGGYGFLSLWSHNRPFMPLSVLEGHRDGAVADFIWLDTPGTPQSLDRTSPLAASSRTMESPHSPIKDARWRGRNLSSGEYSGRDYHTASGSSVFPFDTESREETRRVSTAGIWQHVLSVGRDGRCLLQSFARGDRPISRVPPSCFAMANLSPFQSGYGSLQIFSVHQKVPSSMKDDFRLTGLRRDSISAQAPGVFKEPALHDEESEHDHHDEQTAVEGIRHPVNVPELAFNVLDGGELDHGAPISSSPPAFMMAPEVVHLSRFADSYKFYVDVGCPTRIDLCLHNGDVAERLRCGPLARMWRMLASILQGSGLKELPSRGSGNANAMGFVLLPTLRSLLEQRADAGDVQTCVAVCEVMQVIEELSVTPAGPGTKPIDANDGRQTTRIPGLELNLVREWYMSYIDLLQQMCLFSHATDLIRNCNDPFIGALNQQSTTIHESCPHCRKPLLGGEGMKTLTRRTCKSCRGRVGLCFLCHEPVTGVFVWCPGCGHGGHLDHALEWFGGMSGKPVREMCPTGCGHKCNLVQQVSAFPRTTSLLRLAPTTVTEIDDPLTTA